MMETQSLSSDRISSLPQNIIDTILTLIPIRDALRTSILSKKWRYSWMTMPKLVFDHNLVPVKPVGELMLKYRLVDVIFHVLLMQNCPTFIMFKLDINKLGMRTEFDQMILYLYRRTNVKDLIIDTLSLFYTLPSSFFLLQGLESLRLKYCEFKPPVTFNGFNKLKKMHINNVQVSAQVLLHFLSNCPLLEDVVLIGFESDYPEETSSNFVTFFQCAPLIHTLRISKYYMKLFAAAGGMPNKLPTPLHLKRVDLNVCLREQDVITFALCIIRSSPNLVKLLFEMYDNEELSTQESFVNFVDLQDDLSLTLDNLEHFDILSFSNNKFEMEFVKLIMAKSPVLKIARITLKYGVSAAEELKILRDLIYLPFPRASHSGKLIIKR
ncbi:F-box/FBD/LRR-repeat protein At1g13570-like [Rutidosis leptorrhynchoides]|uniref:F-box/FBD/LRR-repeat protein At1g13570-like n=1 Tax=Rutidosis leptorrhynchoides TaxID=125765 RepID=UPI003A99082C